MKPGGETASEVPPHRPHREIDGVSAVLLPFTSQGRPDLDTFTALVERTFAAGLTPAVNMDTGFVNLLAREERRRVLTAAAAAARGRPFVAGAFIEGDVGEPAGLYRRAVDEIRKAGGTPILFPCSSLGGIDEDRLLAVHADVGREGPPILAFELGTMFVPFGRVFSGDMFARLVDLPAFVGLKHSSLDRCREWERLRIRDARRPEFKIYTGNDLAIDMVFYGSDYLLGLSAFWPEAFAARDRLWANGDPRAICLNDLLQYLGFLAFRDPVPAYKHSAAQFLKLRDAIPSDAPHPAAPRRPDTDIPFLEDIAARIGSLLESVS
jgi:dihydrodipicolinate synthase/N-acetylneuraminate lyase